MPPVNNFPLLNRLHPAQLVKPPPAEAPESPRDSPGESTAPDDKPGTSVLLASPEVRKKGPVLRMGQVSGQWKEGVLVLTRAGFVHWCHEQEVRAFIRHVPAESNRRNGGCFWDTFNESRYLSCGIQRACYRASLLVISFESENTKRRLVTGNSSFLVGRRQKILHPAPPVMFRAIATTQPIVALTAYLLLLLLLDLPLGLNRTKASSGPRFVYSRLPPTPIVFELQDLLVPVAGATLSLCSVEVSRHDVSFLGISQLGLASVCHSFSSSNDSRWLSVELNYPIERTA